MPFNIMSLTTKAITLGCVVHTFSMNLCVYLANSKNNGISFWICIDVHISLRFSRQSILLQKVK